MFSIRKINPMVRAVGTMGAVAALVAGVTFAASTSNTAALTNNKLAAATTTLKVGLTADCSDGANNQPGMNFPNLVPGVTSSQFSFCVANNGNTPLALTAQIPTAVTSTDPSLNPNDVTLHFLCGVGGNSTGVVDTSSSLGNLSLTPLSFGTLSDTTNNVYDCTATATLLAGDSPVSGAKINNFDIDFVGTAGS
jgi:hypothetical protein